MAKNKHTFAKRQREMEKKRKAAEKREKRREKSGAGSADEPQQDGEQADVGSSLS